MIICNDFFSQSVCELGYETLGCITDSSNLNLFLNLISTLTYLNLLWPLPHQGCPSSQESILHPFHLWSQSLGIFCDSFLSFCFTSSTLSGSVSCTWEPIHPITLHWVTIIPSLVLGIDLSSCVSPSGTFYIRQMPEESVQVDFAVCLKPLNDTEVQVEE